MTVCLECSAPQSDGARFCHQCGVALAAPVCRSCAEPIDPAAKFCSGCGAGQGASQPVAPPVSHVASAAVRVTSVLFGDIVGFTSLAESRNQEDVRELLSRYFEECRLIIGRYGGTVEKFIGDAVMAVWGVPTAHEDDAERAVRAGLELVNKVEEFGEELGVTGLALRVGIVTGEVAVTIGADHQGMVAGDAVNTASRVQTAAEPGQVWVDETTKLLTSSAITYVDVGSHRMKGKTDPVPLWSVRAVVAAVRGAQRADGLEAPLVGRDRELRLFKELFHSAEETHKSALFVVDGEPGVGKSRLAWEFEKYIDGLSTPVTWHAGNCVAYGEGVAYYALAEAVRGRLGLGESEVDDPAQLLEAGLRRYVADDEERAWLQPRMGALLGIGSVGNFPREDLFSAWTTFLERAGEGDPVVLLIDDAQYADDGLLLFVEHLLLVGDFACFVVLVTRPGLIESNPTLATNRKATVVHLPVLDPRDMSALLDGLVVGLPDDIRSALVERSDGIPLFAVETVRSLIDRDLVIPRGGQYILADPEALDLASIGAPASLQALIAARLDTLSIAERRVVDQASVVGASFKRDTVAALCDELPDVDSVLTSLVRLQIFDQVSNRLNYDFGSYRFTQSVVRQVAYATLSRRDRKATHLAVIERYQDVGESAGDVAAILAQHYLDAIEAVPADPDVSDLTAAAITELTKAAARAGALGSPAEAAGHLEVALAYLIDERTRPALECDLAFAQIDTGAYADGVAHASRATELFDEQGDELGAARATAAHGLAMIGLSDNAGAVALMRPRWEQLLGREEATSAALSLAYGLSKAGLNLGSDVRDVLEVRVKLAELAGEDGDVADSLLGLSIYYARYGAVTLARVLLEAAADLARTSHHPAALSRSLLNLTVNAMLEDLHRAIELGREAVSVAKSTGLAFWISGAEINLALALWNNGQWDEVDQIFEQHIASVDNTLVFIASSILGCTRAARGESFELPWADGEALASDDNNDIAWHLFAEANHVRKTDLESAVKFAVAATEKMYGLSGTWDDCVHMWPIAVEMAIEASDDVSVARLVDLIDGQTNGRVSSGMGIHRKRVAGLLAMTDDPETAERLLREAIAEFAAWGAVPYKGRTEADLGAFLVAHGRADEAAELLDSARTIFTELGAATWILELDSRLAAAASTHR